MLELLSTLSLERWAFQAVAMCITALLIPGLRVTSVTGPILAVVSLAFLNSHLWSTALFFQLPNTFTTQAGLLILANGTLFWILVKLLPGIEVSGVLPALVAPIVFTVLSVLIETFGADIDWNAVGVWVVEFFSETRDYFLSGQEVSPVTSSVEPAK